MALPLNEGLELVEVAAEKHQEERLWDMWLMQYQHMDKENFVSFEDFLNKFRTAAQRQNAATAKQETAEDILEWAERVKAFDQKGGKAK